MYDIFKDLLLPFYSLMRVTIGDWQRLFDPQQKYHFDIFRI